MQYVFVLRKDNNIRVKVDAMSRNEAWEKLYLLLKEVESLGLWVPQSTINWEMVQ